MTPSRLLSPACCRARLSVARIGHVKRESPTDKPPSPFLRRCRIGLPCDQLSVLTILLFLPSRVLLDLDAIMAGRQMPDGDHRQMSSKYAVNRANQSVIDHELIAESFNIEKLDIRPELIGKDHQG